MTTKCRYLPGSIVSSGLVNEKTRRFKARFCFSWRGFPPGGYMHGLVRLMPDLIGPDGYLYPTMQTIADMLQCSPSMARDLIAKAQRIGMLVRLRRRTPDGLQTSNSYQLLVRPTDDQPDAAPPADDPAGLTPTPPVEQPLPEAAPDRDGPVSEEGHPQGNLAWEAAPDRDLVSEFATTYVVNEGKEPLSFSTEGLTTLIVPPPVQSTRQRALSAAEALARRAADVGRTLARQHRQRLERRFGRFRSPDGEVGPQDTPARARQFD